MARPRVFVTQPIAESALARLRAVADVEVNQDSSRVLDKAKLIEAVKRCDILLSLLHDTVDAGSSCRIRCRRAARRPI